jgi:hypothetical protein
VEKTPLIYTPNMIPNDKQNKLILTYIYICEFYDSGLKYHCQRHSNNNKPQFTDQEVMTVYLFTVDQQRYFSIKEIYTFAKEYLADWFPKLPSYQAFNNRINNLCNAFKILSEQIIENFLPNDCNLDVSLTDSFPIITCKGRNRTAKVAPEITAKGYCSTKDMYYQGVKIHALAFRRSGSIPFPESLFFSSADVNDLTAFKEAFGDALGNRTVYGDKSYGDKEFFSEKETSQNFTILTPIKLVKGKTETIRQREKNL